MKRSYVIALFLALTAPLWSQTVQPKVSFEKSLHDFGKLKEADGKVTYEFTFVNTGGSDLIVQNVSASCGCTAPNWTREPVPPGATGKVAATFNPAGRPGAFRKYVTVVSNAENKSVRLTITGEVEAKPRTVEDDYRFAMGPVRLKSNHLAFGNLKNTTPAEKKLEIINNSGEAATIEFERVPGHLSMRCEPSTLKPGEKGFIVGNYDTPAREDWGFVIDRMGLRINGTSDRSYSLVISANIEEDFSAMSEEDMAKAPMVKVDNPEFKFGKISQGDKVEHEYLLSNTGKSDLVIRKVKASCGCTAVQPEKKVIGPGESIPIKTVFNSAGKVGNQNKTVTIITNDPRKSKLILWVKGEVTKS